MTNENIAKLKIPAIGLLVTGILNILIGLYFTLSAIVVASTGLIYQGFTSDQEKLYFNIGFYGIIILGILSLFIAPVIILGALKMKRGEKYSLAKNAAILAMIPITSAGFLIGIVFGFWAMVNLYKPEVKAAFKS